MHQYKRSKKQIRGDKMRFIPIFIPHNSRQVKNNYLFGDVPSGYQHVKGGVTSPKACSQREGYC